MLFPLALAAQTKFGYFSYSKVLEAVPQYSEAKEDYELLKQRCDKEIERNEEELTRYYVAYLDGQRDFPEPILRKRQNELQQMIDNSVVFRDQLKAWLSEAHDSLFKTSYDMVDMALQRVCNALSLAYAIDADEAVYKYINPNIGVDITGYLIDAVITPASLNNIPAEGVVVSGDKTGTGTFRKSVATDNSKTTTDIMEYNPAEQVQIQ